MAMTKKNAFSRRLPDLVTEELVDCPHTAKTPTSSRSCSTLCIAICVPATRPAVGEEMLRLRAYEKLQTLVSRGMVKKTGQEVQGSGLARERDPDRSPRAGPSPPP